MPFALLLLALSAQPDPIEAAHAHRDPAHVLTVFQAESEIEDVNKHTVTVFGTRREYRCPGGELSSETRCDPCVYGTDAWAAHPEGEWIYEVSYGNEEEHETATRAAEHFARYFELAPRPGQERGGRQHVMFAFSGKSRAPPPPLAIAKLRLLVNGVERDSATIPYGQKDVQLQVEALARNPSGALQLLPDADVVFSAACAVLRPTAPGRALAGLQPGANGCTIDVLAKPGNVAAHLQLARELKLEILFEGQAADEVQLRGSREVDLSFAARALDKDVAVTPRWSGEHGTFQVFDGGKRVRFTLDPGARAGSVRLLDAQSGASDELSVAQQAR